MQHTVNQLPVDPGPAAWDAILSPAVKRDSLQTDIDCDWLVIGGGFAGLSAARRLTELHPQHAIVVLEATQVATGASGRNSGFMIDVPHELTASGYTRDTQDSNAHNAGLEHTRREVRLNRAAIDYACKARDEFDMPDEAIRLSGKINGAMSARGQRHNDSYVRNLNALGEVWQRLNAEDMHAVTGTNAYIDGLQTPGTAMLQPALYTRLLAKGIEGCGVRIFEQTPATSIEQQGDEWIVQTPKGRVRASRLFITVNGHLQSFGFYTQHLAHVFTYGSMTRALSSDEVATLAGESNWALTPADALGTTVRRVSGIGGDRLIIRNRASYDPTMKITEERLSSISQTHDQSFANRFPMLSGVEMEYRWGGRLCMARNGGTVFGEIAPGVYSACCQNGLGTARGTIGGKLVAELASGHESSLLDDIQREPKPNRLPPGLFARIGATLQIRWGEHRAGREL